MRSFRTSLSVLFGVSLLSLCFASATRAGFLPTPFGDETICGNISVAPTMTAASNYSGVAECQSLCRAASAQCHRFVVRVATCDTAFAVEAAAFETRNCNHVADPALRAACRVSVKNSLISDRSTIVSQRDAAFDDCDGWESACTAACP